LSSNFNRQRQYAYSFIFMISTTCYFNITFDFSWSTRWKIQPRLHLEKLLGIGAWQGSSKEVSPSRKKVRYAEEWQRKGEAGGMNPKIKESGTLKTKSVRLDAAAY